MAYELEGTLLEVCTCNVLCPCWVGGSRWRHLRWSAGMALRVGHDRRSGCLRADVRNHGAHTRKHHGRRLDGGWTAVVYIDDGVTDEQQEALINVWTGKLGGPVAELASLVGEVVAVERVPIAFDVKDGTGTIKVGDSLDAELAPFEGATGVATALHDTVFTTIPGSPAYVGKASHYTANVPQLDLNFTINNHNAVQGSFRFELN